MKIPGWIEKTPGRIIARLRHAGETLGQWLRHGPRPSSIRSGRVMGTYYRVTLVGPEAERDPVRPHQEALHALERIESLMSLYRPDSEVCRFNGAMHTDWMALSRETAEVVTRAIDVGRRSGSRYDITAAPLVNLWGFGAHGRRETLPSPAQIEQVRQHVGLDRLEVRLDPPSIRKCRPGVEIDLASVAKGYAVDRAAEAIEACGVRSYCVDVGGEIRVRGRNPMGLLWRVAIESPAAGGDGVHRLVSLRDQAMATSGDYRIFVEQDGDRYSHLLDPATGYPVRHHLASVTVVDASCGRADAWATALLVAGPEEGYALAVREGLAAMFLVREGEGFAERRTPAFARSVPV